MSNRHSMIRLLNESIDPKQRADSVRNISELLGVETFIVFLPDTETGVLLSAAGFPQTLPAGREWRQFLAECAKSGRAERPMPWLSVENLLPTRGVISSEGSVIAFIGGQPKQTLLDELLLVLPLFTAALKGEGIVARQVAEARFAAEITKKSETLARRLDEARRALQKQLEARHATEQLLRAREQELHGVVQELREAQSNLQRHAKELEQRIRERTAKLHDTIAELEGFSYSIAHDMRAPLRAMQSFSQLLLTEAAEQLNDTSKDYLQRIITSASRMDHLIQDVLSYSRVARQEVPLKDVDTDKLILGILESYLHFQSPHVELKIEHPLPPVRGNEAALTQVFSNLIGNAAKFVEPGTKPVVGIRAESRGKEIRFWITDNGIGIAADQHERIFGIFQRLQKDYDGTGIGLAIVKKSIERMRGKLGLESQPGKGSKFWFELPKSEQP